MNTGSGLFASPFGTAQHLKTRDQKRRHIRQTIDVNGFNWFVWAVAASGFFTDSYNLFATNVILPSLAFVYWPNERSVWREPLINCMTLAGSFVGQLLFGFLADKFGRTTLYGIELGIVIFSTIGVASSSTGFGGSMSIIVWLAIWRFVMGLGIGAEYPLSAVITAEWAPTKARTRMMAAIFIMQPIGQLVAQLVGLFVLIGYNKSYNLKECTDPAVCGAYVDGIWRWVTGVGAIPAVLAIVFRFLIKDPGLYDLDVKNRGDRAVENTDKLYPGSSNGSQQVIELLPAAEAPQSDQPLPIQFSWADIREYFWVQENWRYLLGTSACWFLVDFAFFGLGIGDPRTLAKIWTPSYRSINGTVPAWEIDPSLPNSSIFDVLEQAAKRNMITVSIGSLLGSIMFVKLADYIPRKQFLMWSFIWLAFLFAVTGGTFFAVFRTDAYVITIFLTALCYLSFNLGANTITFIIPAEIFPTRYRCSCHGISAAAGKLGSVFVQAILPSMVFGGVNANDPNSRDLGFIFIIFGCIMGLGAFFAWAYIPEVQNRRDNEGGLRLPSKTLEELGKGLRQAEADGQIIGFRKKFGVALGLGDGAGRRRSKRSYVDGV